MDTQIPTTPKTPKSRSSIKSKTPKTPTSKADRFIPSRSGMDMEIGQYLLSKENANPNTFDLVGSPSKRQYNECLAETLFQGKMNNGNAKVLAFKSKAPAPKEGTQNPHKVLYSCNAVSSQTKREKVSRHISQSAERILDAPSYSNDYYLNLMDWSSKNVIAIGLGNAVYLWNAATGATNELLKLDDDLSVCSVQWTKEGRHLAVGKSDGATELWDAEVVKPLRNMRGHAARVGSMSWNGPVLSTGSKDHCIINHDVRIQEHRVAVLEAHTQEVCGLRWSDDGLQLASGGNDNVVNIWDVNQSAPRFSFTEHQAAVKALAWCPWQQNLLATGGGTADRTLRFWNTNTGALLNSIDTESQVSSIIWSQSSGCREVVTSHGFSQNQLCVWKYPSLVKVAELRGHSDRILQMSQSPDGSTIVSAAADETLRFWRIFESEVAQKAPVAKAVASKPQSWTANLR